MNTKYIHQIHPFFMFRPFHWHPPLEKTCFTRLYTSIVQGSFALVLRPYIYHALITLTLSPYYLLNFYHHAPLIVNSLQYSMLYCILISMYCFNIVHSLKFSFLLPPPIFPSDRFINTILSFHTIYVCVCMCMIIYASIYTFNINLASTYEGNHVTFDFLSLAYFT
jgi:hypothetical protein